jgi:hypothetical protein
LIPWIFVGIVGWQHAIAMILVDRTILRQEMMPTQEIGHERTGQKSLGQ